MGGWDGGVVQCQKWKIKKKTFWWGVLSGNKPKKALLINIKKLQL